MRAHNAGDGTQKSALNKNRTSTRPKFQKKSRAIKFNFAPPALKAWRISILAAAISPEIFPRLCVRRRRDAKKLSGRRRRWFMHAAAGKQRVLTFAPTPAPIFLPLGPERDACAARCASLIRPAPNERVAPRLQIALLLPRRCATAAEAFQCFEMRAVDSRKQSFKCIFLWYQGSWDIHWYLCPWLLHLCIIKWN